MAMTAQSGKQTWTILRLLEWTTKHFRAAGICNPRLNAEVLLGHVLGVDRIMLYARFERVPGEEDRARFRELVRRRAAREPLQYLTGRCEFYGRPFEVTPAVMVPRAETELLVDACLKRLPAGACRAADVCTGSGVVAVTLAAERPDLHVAATDSSADALAVAGRNAAALGVSERVAFGRGDLAEPLSELLPCGRSTVDLLAANPPYVCSADIETVAPEVRDHEPRAALDGGPDGLDVIRRLVPAGAAVLPSGGWLILELGEGQAPAVAALAALTGAFRMETVETVSDTAGCERVFCVCKR
ncbi:MAG: peptide chain release factor N(5)-glutamine methyltransferase [Candidatus Brocadiaceae bacterium]|nr:peptide chain release factor N(5)-glutamine methyltransferase [Candidatus Brocadiaceae bacterium]